MVIRKHVQTLVMASILALSLMSLPIFQVSIHALTWDGDKAGCEAAGYYYDKTTGKCADQDCVFHDVVFHPGQTVQYPGSDGKLHSYMCDGLTGEMDELLTTPPHPVHPGAGGLPTRTGSGTPLQPAGTVLPHPAGLTDGS